MGWGHAFSQVLWRSDERNERSRCRGFPLGYDTENREMERRTQPKLLLQQEHCVEVRNQKGDVMFSHSSMSMSSAEGFPLGYGCRYADAAAINKRRKRDVFQNQKGNTKRIGNALFY